MENTKNLMNIDSDLKNIKNELHNLNIFMDHICRVIDSLVAAGDRLEDANNSSEKPTL